jgi:hypothetical protein
MTDAEHFRKLEQLYAAAPISQWYGATAAIGDGHTEVSLAIRPEFHHAAHAVHGSFLTVSFTVQLVRQVASGEFPATGYT